MSFALRWRVFVLGLAVACGMTLILPPSSSAQEEGKRASAPDGEEKRKVKTQMKPHYPDLARQMHVSGKVKVLVEIGADGRVKSTRVIGGHPLLVDTVLDAIKQWRYEPSAKTTAEVVEVEFKGPGN